MTTGRDDKEQAQFEESSDFANYFCTYEFLYHQKQMLEDTRRMSAYRDAIMNNRRIFEGKIVLDVGAGSGILSIWAAKAGAKKVYGVEATKVAAHAKRLVEANDLSDTVEIIRSTIEDTVLPVDKVDVIISEWMGYFLLRESMLDSVIYARDKWLKPGGSLWPSHARMYLAPIYNEEGLKKNMSYQDTLQEWGYFVKDTKSAYDVDLACLTPAYRNEQWDFFMQTASWMDLPASDIVGTPSCVADIDLNTCKLGDYERIKADFSCTVKPDCRITGFAGWFDNTFCGAPENPARKPYVVLDTAPGMGYTHWGQQVFHMYPPLSANSGDVISGQMDMFRRPDNKRLQIVELKYTHKNGDTGEVISPEVTTKYNIH